jgi:hypothetical protein
VKFVTHNVKWGAGFLQVPLCPCIFSFSGIFHFLAVFPDLYNGDKYFGGFQLEFRPKYLFS